MSTFDVRDAICEIGRRVWQRGYVAANDGNFSYRLDADTVLATPTQISKGFMTPDDLVLVDLDGNQKAGKRASTSEIRVHLNAYRHRPDIRSVVHVHPPHASAFAITHSPLPKGVLEEFELYLGEVPVVPYETTGTWEFARTLDPWIDTHDAFVLSNHGAVTFGADPFDAYYRMEVLDHVCRIFLLSRQEGAPLQKLAPAMMERLMRKKADAGINDPRAGLLIEEHYREEVLPRRRAGETPSFSGEAFDGLNWPRVTDEPKNSTAPTPGPLEKS